MGGHLFHKHSSPRLAWPPNPGSRSWIWRQKRVNATQILWPIQVRTWVALVQWWSQWKTWFCLLGHTQKWRIQLGVLITESLTSPLQDGIQSEFFLARCGAKNCKPWHLSFNKISCPIIFRDALRKIKLVWGSLQAVQGPTHRML